MSYSKIARAEAIGDRIIRVELTNREIKDYDISSLIEKPMFSPLRQPAFFRNFKVEPGGHGLVWNDDIDISEYELWAKGKTVQINDDSAFTSALLAAEQFLAGYSAEDAIYDAL